MDCSGKKKRARNLMPVYSEDKDNNENAKNSQKTINESLKKFDDFLLIASTLESESPVRDAYKAVFGVDRPDLDPNTPEGMRVKNKMNAYMGKKED
jgi:hypothetical protein